MKEITRQKLSDLYFKRDNATREEIDEECSRRTEKQILDYNQLNRWT